MASSCVFNNYFDRELDLKMERTRNRSLPTGRLTPKVVLSYAIILGVLGLTVLFAFRVYLPDYAAFLACLSMLLFTRFG